ncbi:hypothetical protein [Burkholderia sp. Bp8991]|uniref:hypothetical protein n=1 Tax=Burkholderia sp. Bp8991 TaxID=2184553 RepID=UPI000F59BEF8|nr:hypothetical protein [Burkholderia sp. Bp8991]
MSTGTAAETELFGISLAKPLKVRECPSVPTSYKEADVSFGAEAEAKVSELVVALYQQKLTYGEFAQRRYAISTAAASAARQYREARLLQDEDRQLQAQQLANQQLENSHERMGKLHAGRQLAPAADGALDQRAGPLLIDEHGQYGEHEL